MLIILWQLNITNGRPNRPVPKQNCQLEKRERYTHVHMHTCKYTPKYAPNHTSTHTHRQQTPTTHAHTHTHLTPTAHTSYNVRFIYTDMGSLAAATQFMYYTGILWEETGDILVHKKLCFTHKNGALHTQKMVLYTHTN